MLWDLKNEFIITIDKLELLIMILTSWYYTISNSQLMITCIKLKNLLFKLFESRRSIIRSIIPFFY